MLRAVLSSSYNPEIFLLLSFILLLLKLYYPVYETELLRKEIYD